MDRGLYVAATGSLNHDIRIETITNNIAAAGVPGFKKDLVVFDRVEAAPGYWPGTPDMGLPEKVFVNTAGTFTDFSQGVIKPTKNPLDVAISGEGFFVVQTGAGTRYTRKGDFRVDSDGVLKTADGHAVEGQGGVITLTPGDVSIDRDGAISINGAQVDTLKVMAFKEPYPLIKEAGALFKALDGAVETEAAGFELAQGSLEAANINVVHEMVSMIDAMRAYESHIKLMHSFDEITQKALRLPGSSA